VQQVRDLLECVWSAVLDAAAQPFKSITWVAAMTVVVARDDGNLARTRRLGLDRFTRLVRAEVTRRGKAKPSLRIVRKIFAALTAAAGVVEHRQAALERIGWILTDWERARADQIVEEARMVAVLGQLELTDLVCSIHGLSPVGAAAILAKTGDLRRFTSARAVVKLAGLAPRERMSGTFAGKARCPVLDVHGCGWRPGGRYGDAYRTTGCTPPDTGT
jgi:transposase